MLKSIASVLAISLFCVTAEAADFYVAPDGNDAWSGTLAAANADKTDGPFATLERARDAIRQRKAAGARDADASRDGDSGGIVNGGFETGNLTGWTPAGTASVVTGGHSGTYAARVGSTSPTNGDSSIAQTFTVPSGQNTLTFWYKIVCPDTITYDWATATLKDNTAATTTTVLAKTCSNTGAWS